MINIVLLEPEIPHNTGAIGRTCVSLGAKLHLIGPLGFSLEEKQVKRAGLDYWQYLDYTYYPNYEDFCAKNPKIRAFYASTKSHHTYTEVNYQIDDYIFFGKESAGIPEEILVEHPDECIRIPMLKNIRSLNLSNAVAIVAYEAARQLDFFNLENNGALHRLEWNTSKIQPEASTTTILSRQNCLDA